MNLSLATLSLSLSLWTASMVGPSLAAPAASLKIDCKFVDPDILDRVEIELQNDRRGTFYYAPETEPGEDPAPTEKLALKRVDSEREEIARWRVDREEVGLYYLMPIQLVSKPTASFKATLLTQIPELSLSHSQELNCSSK